MDLVRRLGEKKAITKEKFRQLQENDKLQNMLEERKKSANRRELEAHIKKQEENQITEELRRIRKKEQSDFFSGKQNNVLQKGKSMLTDNKKLFEKGSKILDQKNIFKNNKNMFFDGKNQIPITNKEHMFFK